MEELTIEQKAKRYDEAIEIAKSKIKNDKDHVLYEEDIIKMFPELKKKTDEEIRQQLIAVCHLYYGVGDNSERDECLEWLEKQSNKPQGKSALEAIKEEKIDNANKVEPKFKVGDIVQYITDSTDRRKIEEVDTFCNMYHTDSSPIMFEIEDEWKVVVNAEDVEQNLTDEGIKTEPNLKVGDWIVKKDGKIFHDGRNFAQITKIDRSMCQFDNGRWLYDYEIRTWSISDVQDGDILASSNNKAFIYNGYYNECFVGAYCGLDIDDEFVISNQKCHWTDNCNIRPATKEERKRLFTEMNLFGWIWNPETKELNRLGKDEENNN